MATISQIRTQIFRIENVYGINLGCILLVRSDRRISAAVEDLGGGRYRIELPIGFGRRELLEDLMHELSHVYRWRYGLAQSKSKAFRGGRKAGFTQDEIKFYDEYDRPDGYVSSYAATSADEDYAETMACYFVNNGKTKGVVEYNGERINLNSDPKLKQKLKMIEKLLSRHLE